MHPGDTVMGVARPEETLKTGVVVVGVTKKHPLMSRRWSIGFRLIAGITVHSFAYAADPYGLSDALMDAMMLDPRMELAQAEKAAALTKVDIARGTYYPSVSAQAGAGDFAGETEYQLNVRQMLYDWGRASSQVDSSKAQASVSGENLRLTQSSIAFDVADTYLSYGQSRDAAAIYGEYLKALENLIVRAENRSRGRFSSNVEVERVILEQSRAREARARYLGWMEVARQDFIQHTGKDPHALSLQDPPYLPLLENGLNSEVALENQIKNAPRVTAEMAEVRRAKAELNLAKAELYPQLSLEADWVRREFNETIDSNVIVALRLRSETYFGLSNFRRPEAARFQVQARNYQVKSTQRELRRNVRELAATQPTMKTRISSLEEQAKSSLRIMDIYEKQFTAGLRNFDDLLSVIRDHFEARRQKTELKTELLRKQYEVAADFGVFNRLVTDMEGEDNRGR